MAITFIEPKLNNIRLNHIGFLNKSAKKFVYLGKGVETFTVKKMLDANLTEVFSGKLKYCPEDDLFPEAYVGDFSAVTESGIYQITCGEDESRLFAIDNEVYNYVLRLLATFFVWQRCGTDTGWNGRCHQGEKLIDKNGKLHEFSGGHHQSGDLRKWSFGCPKGIKSLSDFKDLADPLWDKGDIKFDIAHSAKYYLSLISDEGYVFDCTFVPFDYDKEKCAGKGFGGYGEFWKPFKYFDRPTTHEGNYNVISLLATAAISLKEYDSALAAECEKGAKKVWEYMCSKGEFEGDYDWEIYPPIGHDTFKANLFDYFYKDSAWMLCGKGFAGIELYKMSGDESVKEAVVSALSKIYSYMIKEDDGSLKYFKLDAESTKVAEEMWYFQYNFPLLFAEALDTFAKHPDRAKWLEVVTAAVKKFEKMADNNCYGKVTNQYVNDNGTLKPDYFAYLYNDDHAQTAKFLIKVSKYMDKEKCLNIAQGLLDWIMGFNPFDASSIEGAGFNQVKQCTFGEFMPALPQIPGGVCTDLSPTVFKWMYGSEYDNPVVGNVLMALALLIDEFKKMS